LAQVKFKKRRSSVAPMETAEAVIVNIGASQEAADSDPPGDRRLQVQELQFGGSYVPPSTLGRLVGDDVCVICLEPLRTRAQTIAICGHIFHRQCLNAASRQSGVCPQCRQRIDVEPEEDAATGALQIPSESAAQVVQADIPVRPAIRLPSPRPPLPPDSPVQQHQPARQQELHPGMRPTFLPGGMWTGPGPMAEGVPHVHSWVPDPVRALGRSQVVFHNAEELSSSFASPSGFLHRSFGELPVADEVPLIDWHSTYYDYSGVTPWRVLPASAAAPVVLTIEAETSPSFASEPEESGQTPATECLTEMPHHLPRSLAIQFELLEGCVLGRGSYAVVCAVRDRHTQRMHALKVMARRPLEIRGLEEQAFREMTLQRDLVHPNILSMFQAFEADDHFYMITEYAPFGSLQSCVTASGPLSEVDCSFYLSQVASAVQYLHSDEIRILHRDLKAGNVLLVSSELAKVADFGWSINFSDSCIPSGPAGTTSHMAPEVVDAQHHGTAADCWSLGVLLYEVLVGSLPFADVRDVRRVAFQDPDFLSPPARNLIRQLLRRDQGQRLRATEVLQHQYVVEGANLRAPQVGNSSMSAGMVARVRRSLTASRREPLRSSSLPREVPSMLATSFALNSLVPAVPRRRAPERSLTDIARRGISVGSLTVAPSRSFMSLAGSPGERSSLSASPAVNANLRSPGSYRQPSGVATPAAPAPTMLIQARRAVSHLADAMAATTAAPARPLHTPRSPRRSGAAGGGATRPGAAGVPTTPEARRSRRVMQYEASPGPLSPSLLQPVTTARVAPTGGGLPQPPRVVHLPQPSQWQCSMVEGATRVQAVVQQAPVSYVAPGPADCTPIQSAACGRHQVTVAGNVHHPVTASHVTAAATLPVTAGVFAGPTVATIAGPSTAPQAIVGSAPPHRFHHPLRLVS